LTCGHYNFHNLLPRFSSTYAQVSLSLWVCMGVLLFTYGNYNFPSLLRALYLCMGVYYYLPMEIIISLICCARSISATNFEVSVPWFRAVACARITHTHTHTHTLTHSLTHSLTLSLSLSLSLSHTHTHTHIRGQRCEASCVLTSCGCVWL
jgi:hypothetical protein